MSRVFATVVLICVIFLGIDAAVEAVLRGELMTRQVVAEREEIYRQRMFKHFRDLARDNRGAIARDVRRWEQIEDEPPSNQIRVVVIGNSTAQFAIASHVLERRIASAYPDRDVLVFSFLYPAIRVADEAFLIEVALRKKPTVVILTPNLIGLNEGDSTWSSTLREAYGDEVDPSSPRGIAELFRGQLRRHWRLYRFKDELRAMALESLERAWPWAVSEAAERERLGRIMDEISQAARAGDMAALVSVYRDNEMSNIVTAILVFRAPSATSPVFATMREMAEALNEAGVIAIAAFLPVHPLFRDWEATRPYPGTYVDDGEVRTLAARTMRLFDEAGFVTSMDLDSLPAWAFVDRIHANAEGMRLYSEKLSGVVIDALRDRLEPSMAP